MTHSKALPAVIVLVVLEGMNTVINILPALKEPTIQGKNKKLVRAGVINFILLAGFIAYLELSK